MPADYIKLLSKVAEDVIPVANARIAACLVRKGKILSFGTNRKVTHPFQKKYSATSHNIFLHAEIDCIKNALKRHSDKDISNSTLYVTRIKRPHTNSKIWITGNSMPCKGCRACIKDYNIKEVIHT